MTPLDVWRAEASLVWARWERLREADSTHRAAAFSAYLDALDAEAAAAEVLAHLQLEKAA